jgi:hypothetical protein
MRSNDSISVMVRLVSIHHIHLGGNPEGIKQRQHWVVVRFESSHLTIAMEAWNPASLKAMPPQLNIM